MVALAAIAIVSARAALAREVHEIDEERRASVRPRHPVLICNPWSGGGKVEKFCLVELANELGIETVLLDRGLDLDQLARDAICSRRRLPGHSRRRRIAGTRGLDRDRARHPFRLCLGRDAQPSR